MKEVVAEQLAALARSGEESEAFVFRVLEEAGKVVGFLLLQRHEVESITREKQSLLCDYHAQSWEQFAFLMEQARAFTAQGGDTFLIGWNYSDSRQKAEWLERFGFRRELVRAVKVVPAGCRGYEHPDYRMRPATTNDTTFIMRLVAENSPIYCPAHRDVDIAKVQAGFVNAYSSLGLRNKKKMPLIFEHKESEEPVGYLIVEPGRAVGPDKRLILYIYDIALAPELGRRGLSRALCGAGETLLGGMGGGVYYGDISADNVPALGAQKSIGFEVDSVRWGLPVGGTQV